MKYIHIRQYKKMRGVFDGHIEAVELDGKGGATIAYTINDDGSVTAALALCHEDDNFCRKIGRQIAAGRHAAGKTVTFSKNLMGTTDEERYDSLVGWANDYRHGVKLFRG